jgi:hypothetical protein
LPLSLSLLSPLAPLAPHLSFHLLFTSHDPTPLPSQSLFLTPTSSQSIPAGVSFPFSGFVEAHDRPPVVGGEVRSLNPARSSPTTQPFCVHLLSRNSHPPNSFLSLFPLLHPPLLPSSLPQSHPRPPSTYHSTLSLILFVPHINNISFSPLLLSTTHPLDLFLTYLLFSSHPTLAIARTLSPKSPVPAFLSSTASASPPSFSTQLPLRRQ